MSTRVEFAEKKERAARAARLMTAVSGADEIYIFVSPSTEIVYSPLIRRRETSERTDRGIKNKIIEKG